MSLTSPEIKLTDIDSQLKKLQEVEKGQKREHASLFNLIVYTEKHAKERVQKELLEPLMAKFPCRIFLIVSHGNKNELLRTSVTASFLTKEMYCETIEIEVGGELHKRIPFLILPHLVVDLPLYLLWTVDQSQDPLVLPQFEKVATKLILDPIGELNLEHFAKDALGLLKQMRCSVTDLNWTALTPLRKIFASAFETYERFLTLTSTKWMQITYKKIPSPFFHASNVRAAYFQAWIASTLGWKFKHIEGSGSEIRLTYTKAAKEIIVLLTPDENPLNANDLPAGTLLQIALDSTYKKGEWKFIRNPLNKQLAIHYEDQEKCDLPVYNYLTGSKEGDEILDEIFYTTPQAHYKATLQMLSHIPWSSLQ